MPYFSSCLGLQNVWGRPWVQSTIFNTARLVSCFLLLFIFKLFLLSGFFIIIFIMTFDVGFEWFVNFGGDGWVGECMWNLRMWLRAFFGFKVQKVSVLLIVSLLRMCAKTEEYGKWNFQFIKMFNLVKQEQMVNMVNPAKTR